MSAPINAPWLHIIGFGADGLDSLHPAARTALMGADVIIGGQRHHDLSVDIAARRIAWPSPFDALIDQLNDLRGQRVAVLATGDPLWYSVGARIGRVFAADEVMFYPQLSAFQLAAARMKWSLADIETLTVHGRPIEQIIPFIQPKQRLLVLTTGAETPAQMAAILVQQGYGASQITALCDMGGKDEAKFTGTADGWFHASVPAFNTLAIDCIAGANAIIAPRGAGLPDDMFTHDGQITKREVRAITLAKLMPMRDAVLWDIGAGCGSVAIEWMRSAPNAQAIAVEQNALRRSMIAQNAAALGTPRLQIIAQSAPDAIADLPQPDAVFIGGGFSQAVFEQAWAALQPMGRCVVNAVTLESQQLMLDLQKQYGGDLAQLSIARSTAVGGFHGWRPFMPVTQWSLIKR